MSGDTAFRNACRAGWITLAVLTLGGVVQSDARAGGVQTLEEVDVLESPDALPGSADAATRGTVTHEQLAVRPLLRRGELPETAPGAIITQHSGDDKANRFFLRGFNLDHGTDLATWPDGVPINLPTHGQGHTDLNLVIPEPVSNVQYR